MTDIEQRALELWGPGIAAEVNLHNFAILGSAFIEMRDRHEAFEQEVSDAMEEYCELWAPHFPPVLNQFIIPAPKPDPLAEMLEKDFGGYMPDAEDFRAALNARGLEIRSKNDDR